MKLQFFFFYMACVCCLPTLMVQAQVPQWQLHYQSAIDSLYQGKIEAAQQLWQQAEAVQTADAAPYLQHLAFQIHSTDFFNKPTLSKGNEAVKKGTTFIQQFQPQEDLHYLTQPCQVTVDSIQRIISSQSTFDEWLLTKNQATPLGSPAYRPLIAGEGEMVLNGLVWQVNTFDGVTLADGTTIKQAQSAKAWKTAAAKHQPAWCYVKRGFKKSKQKVYNGYVLDKIIAKPGYRMASALDFTQLQTVLVRQSDSIQSRFITYSGFRNENGGFQFGNDIDYRWSYQPVTKEKVVVFTRRKQNAITTAAYDKAFGLPIQLVKE